MGALERGYKAKARFVRKGKTSPFVDIITLDDVVAGRGFVKSKYDGRKCPENRRLRKFIQSKGDLDSEDSCLPVVIESYDPLKDRYFVVPAMHELKPEPVVKKEEKETEYAVGRFIRRTELDTGEKAVIVRIRIGDSQHDATLVLPEDGNKKKRTMFHDIFRKFKPGQEICIGNDYVGLEVTRSDGKYNVVADPDVRL